VAAPDTHALHASPRVEGRSRGRALALVAAISGLYDGFVGAFLLLAPGALASLFGVPPATPRIFSDLNALFLLAVAAGYILPWRDPVRYRGYLWVMGPLLKGAGAVVFILDYLFRGSPAAFLLFAASDGMLALITLGALLGTRSIQHSSLSR
jgi:hypothetical protein